MAAKTILKFNPDYTVAPGETLLETLESLGMKQAELAERTGLSTKHINGIIKGKNIITPDTALNFERVFGVPASFWNNLEKNHQEQLSRLRERKSLKPSTAWLKDFPVKEMVGFGWIKRAVDEVGQMGILLDFFGISHPDQWGKVWSFPQAVFRSSTAHQSKPGPLSAWLRKGELDARNIPLQSYDRDKFVQTQKDIRALTEKTDPNVFVKELTTICAECGVAVVFVPEVPGTCAYGATRWVGGRPVIQLSLRYKTNDHLWFTFFHEVGHILLHGKKEMFLETQRMNVGKEAEANEYAGDLLIPPAEYAKFTVMGDFSEAAIRSFACKVKIAPGIVVGRLQHDELLDFKFLSKVKVHYRWADSN
jgi:addiction module HigA family antidote